MNKLISIDLMRGFAAFAVFYYHQHLGFTFAKKTGLNFLNLTDQIGSTYAVPLFFLISGFCIHLSCLKQLTNNEPLPLKTYYLNRFFRIYPAYFFSLIFSIIIINITVPGSNVSLKDLLVHLFVGQGFSSMYFNTINLVLWTITIEMVFYLIYPAYYYINRKFNAHSALFFSLLASSISIAIFMINNQALSFPQLYLFTNLWFGWCFGAWLCDQYFREPTFFKSTKWILITVIIAAIFLSLQLIQFTDDILIRNLSNILIWAPILISLIKKEENLRKMKKWLKIPIALGLSSYSLYLFHIPLIAIKNFLISNYISQNYNFLIMAIGTILIPIACYYSYYTIEIYFMKIGRNINKKL